MHLNEDYSAAVKGATQLQNSTDLAIKIEDLYKAFGNLKVLQGI